jgi:hypothetical protein
VRPMDVVDWLLDSDPAIRWQVMRDLTGEPAEVVDAERAKVATEGWGARLLARQTPDGRWGEVGYTRYVDSPDGQSLHALILLRDMGLDPASAQARQAVARVRAHITHYEGGQPFFEGETEACINGRVLTLGAYFGAPNEALLARLLAEQLEDGGWNCAAPPSIRSSFHSTICVLEGLLEYERAKGASAAVTEARARAENYLLERHLFRSLSSGEVIKSAWTLFSFPPGYHYDVLRGLDYLRAAGAEPVERTAEAVELMAQHRGADGRWPLQNPHGDLLDLDMEPADEPSRWNTLRALRVLAWADRGGSSPALS